MANGGDLRLVILCQVIVSLEITESQELLIL